jgi:hypothetical protein
MDNQEQFNQSNDAALAKRGGRTSKGHAQPCEVWRVPGDGEICARANHGVNPREAVREVLRVLAGRV